MGGLKAADIEGLPRGGRWNPVAYVHRSVLHHLRIERVNEAHELSCGFIEPVAGASQHREDPVVTAIDEDTTVLERCGRELAQGAERLR